MELSGWGAVLNRARNVGVAIWAIFVGFTVFIIYIDTEPVDFGAWVYVAVSALVVGLVWWLAVARPLVRVEGNTPAKIGLVLGILGIVASIPFWMAFNAVFGIAAIVLGVEGTRRARRGEGRAGLAKAATILGGIAVAAFVVIWVSFAIAELT